jgi:hypothetical protein
MRINLNIWVIETKRNFFYFYFDFFEKKVVLKQELSSFGFLKRLNNKN